MGIAADAALLVLDDCTGRAYKGLVSGNFFINLMAEEHHEYKETTIELR